MIRDYQRRLSRLNALPASPEDIRRALDHFEAHGFWPDVPASALEMAQRIAACIARMDEASCGLEPGSLSPLDALRGNLSV